MQDRLLSLARRLVPQLEEQEPTEQATIIRALVVMTLLAPLAIFALVWLAAQTRLAEIGEKWWLAVIIAVITPVFLRLNFQLTTELHRGTYITISTTLSALIDWSAVLILGPSIIWVPLAWGLLDHLGALRHGDARVRVISLFNMVYDVNGSVLAPLAALWAYERLGGVYPLPGLSTPHVTPALAATAVLIITQAIIAVPFLLSLVFNRTFTPEVSVTPLQYMAATLPPLLMVFITEPFGVLAAGVYGAMGAPAYLALVVLVMLGSFTAYAFSRAAERARQRSAEMQRLEALARAIIGTPPGEFTLPDLLREHLPGMFIFCSVVIRRFSDGLILYRSEEDNAIVEEAWRYLQALDAPRLYRPGEHLPWADQPASLATLLVPITATGDSAPRAGMIITRREHPRDIEQVLPAAQSLASQIASALQSIDIYEQTLAHQRTHQELALAGQIQRSFLPQNLPRLEQFRDWEIAVTIESARETSGDFFDLIPMWDGRLGIVIADVADKGLGAALYMALSRTLIRTYAVEYSTRYPQDYAFHPERVLNTVNRAIMEDTANTMFVTVFFGFIDPTTSSLVYCNAGHNPPLLFSPDQRGTVQALTRTGIPVGVLEDVQWERGSVRLEPGDLLVLYTDGITDAENGSHDYFGEERLRRSIAANLRQPAGRIRSALIEEVRAFCGGAPQFDDITLMLIRKPFES
ncbi:MAG: hypothetical protein Kow00124_31770 [Anaerolineae bacterium]